MSWLSTVTNWFTAKTIHWEPSLGLVSQLAHFAWGGLGVYFLADTVHLHWLLAAGIVTVLAGVKEFFIDVKIIEGDTYLSSGWDFTWYMMGILLVTHFVRHPPLMLSETQAPPVVATSSKEEDGPELYPNVPVAKIATWVRPRAKVNGLVTLVKHEADGDWHFQLADPKDKKTFIVCEIIPELPMDHPKLGDHLSVEGVVRWDGEHKWGELHPVTNWKAIGSK